MAKKEVIGYVIKNKEWLLFESISHAAEHFELEYNQVFLVINGTFKQCKGVCFHFNTEDFDEQILAKLNRDSTKGKSNQKKLLVTNLEGKKVAEYEGLSEASRQLNISKTSISRCANGFRKNNNYQFKFI